tara:strand:+ start:100 stop:324 length:225 start_codon:yes stop_codon:yes gene_type:complete
MPKFEVAIYNQEVCDEIAKGDNHKLFDDEWAELHFIEVSAENEEGAKAQLQNRYPTDKGFVIDSIVKIEDSKFE